MNLNFKPGRFMTVKEVLMSSMPSNVVRTQGMALKFENQNLTLQGLDNISTIEVETDLVNLPVSLQSFYMVIGEVKVDYLGGKKIRATVCRELVFRKYNVDYYEKEMMRCLN
ncbi:unnamed protein product [Blepharisma stoltei]|uniref:Uncharacterized protein n=1 Tax=Blepharisma stoltei TaxID=1481888 RepID=A0AAU9JH80_9CILI|nr:unnamed protein product [Blepharisma stoltei]